jgi:hypothetical protein
MSSYRPDEMSPSDQADIASWTQPPEPACELCGADHHIDPDASDAAGLWLCVECVEATLEAEIVQ